ncbi:LysR family transcriptional regulator [Photobacterium sp. OFAV2-7]|uniref:LysR family transcriptional regulator n=1 Tax=Photobacterium sp. OFAV2-7 TaxID=2917748 RepID=UPI001EF57E5C|nr:LysR family transcriptional regulator [Photobacterium sp. OFAV2-7]MCG7587871.1 LysR family transcriptional regulator [Photobacterium sp. OFAV2-7]
MDRFHQMQVFQAVAEEEGFAAAARRLQMSPPAVTRTVAALEDRLGVKLLNRTTRYVRTTEAGERYLEDARRLLAEVEAADEAAAGINAEPRGHLAVTAPVLFGRMFVMSGIVEYLQRYPEMKVDAIFLDRVVSLVEEGLDVGVRIGELPDSSMRALRVGTVRMVVVASPDYLDQHGEPEIPSELQNHSIIASSAGNFAIGWRFASPKGEQSIRLQPRLTVTTNDSAIEAAVQGLGITRVLSYQVASHIADGSLKVLLSEHELKPSPVHIVHREGRYASVKVRSFIDMLAQRLRSDAALNEPL